VSQVYVTHTHTQTIFGYLLHTVFGDWLDVYRTTDRNGNEMTIKRDYYHYVPTAGILYIDVVVGLAWSNDPESYDGGSVATVPCRTGQRL
jgi:hypothetical protein